MMRKQPRADLCSNPHPSRSCGEKEEPHVTPKTPPCAQAKRKMNSVRIWEKISRIFKNTHHTALHSGCPQPHFCRDRTRESNLVKQIPMDGKAAPQPLPTLTTEHQHELTQFSLHRQTLGPGHWPHPAADLPVSSGLQCYSAYFPLALWPDSQEFCS